MGVGNLKYIIPHITAVSQFSNCKREKVGNGNYTGLTISTCFRCTEHIHSRIYTKGIR